MMNTGDGSARRLSDFLTGEELHLLELYTSFMYGPLGVESQVVVGLPAPGPSVVGIALNRAGSDFINEELKLLDALRPYLGAGLPHRPSADRMAPGPGEHCRRSVGRRPCAPGRRHAHWWLVRRRFSLRLNLRLRLRGRETELDCFSCDTA